MVEAIYGYGPQGTVVEGVMRALCNQSDALAEAELRKLLLVA